VTPAGLLPLANQSRESSARILRSLSTLEAPTKLHPLQLICLRQVESGNEHAVSAIQARGAGTQHSPSRKAWVDTADQAPQGRQIVCVGSNGAVAVPWTLGKTQVRQGPESPTRYKELFTRPPVQVNGKRVFVHSTFDDSTTHRRIALHQHFDRGNHGPALDEAIFEGDAGSIRISPSGEVRLGYTLIPSNNSALGYRGDSVYAAQAHFIDCLRTGTPFESEGQDYLEKTFAAVEAAYASVATRAHVELRDIVTAAQQ
jgi:hypothetical protein